MTQLSAKKSPALPRGSKKTDAPVSAELQADLQITSKNDFLTVYKASPLARVGLIRCGVAAYNIGTLAEKMDTSKTDLYRMLDLSPASMDRKVREHKNLSSAESERVVGIARLIGQVQNMVEESGDPGDFDAPTWLAAWMAADNPALGAKPSDFMDTMEGQNIVSNLLLTMQTGAYA